MIKLSERLQSVANLITPGLKVADIGTDHGYLGIYLVKNNLAETVIASDVNVGPLQKANANISMYELSGVIDTRLSDGLKMYEPGEVDSIVMAGMGGNLIIDIMINGREVCESAKELILQPQSDIGRVRHYLQDNGYMIISENMVCEDNKFYPMMKAIPGKQRWDREIYFTYGKILLREENPVLREYLILEKHHLHEIYNNLACEVCTDSVMDRMDELTVKIALNNEALELVEHGNTIAEDRIIT